MLANVELVDAGYMDVGIGYPDMKRMIDARLDREFLFAVGTNFEVEWTVRDETFPPRVRVAHFGDTFPSDLDRWLRAVGHEFDLRKISDDYIADTSSRNGGFDVLLVCGSDPIRLRKFLRFYKPALAGKVKIALLQSTKPRGRARLLNSGFDDVFDLKMPAPEARTRIAAIVTRMGVQPATDRDDLVVMGSIGPVDVRTLAFDRLTPRETKLLGLLAETPGRPVPIAKITERLSAEGKPIRVATIRVAISKLRQKLHDNVKVHAHEHFTYSLITRNIKRRPRNSLSKSGDLLFDVSERTRGGL